MTINGNCIPINTHLLAVNRPWLAAFSLHHTRRVKETRPRRFPQTPTSASLFFTKTRHLLVSLESIGFGFKGGLASSRTINYCSNLIFRRPAHIFSRCSLSDQTFDFTKVARLQILWFPRSVKSFTFIFDLFVRQYTSSSCLLPSVFYTNIFAKATL